MHHESPADGQPGTGLTLVRLKPDPTDVICGVRLQADP